MVAAVCPEGKLEVGRRLVQVPDRGPLAVHQHGHQQEDADLAGHRHRHQHRLPPAPPDEGGERHRQHGQGGDGQGAADLGGEHGGVVEVGVALAGQPAAQAGVGPADAVVVDDLGQHPADAHQGHRQHDGAGEQVQGRGHALAEPPPARGQGGLAVVGARVERSTGRQAAIGLLLGLGAATRRILRQEGEQTILSLPGPATAMLALPLRWEVAGRRGGTAERRKGATVPSARIWRRAAVVGGLGLAGVYAFEAAQYHRTAGKGFELEDPPAPGTPDFARMVEALTTAPLRQGNRVTVLRNGYEIFPAMLEAIRSARADHQLRHLRVLDRQHRPRVRRGPGRAGQGRGRGQRAARRRRGGQDGPLPDRPAGGRRGQGGLVPAAQVVHPAQAEQPHPPQDPGGRRPGRLHRRGRDRRGVDRQHRGRRPLARHPRAGRGPGRPRPVRRLPRQLGRGDPVHPVRARPPARHRRLRRRRPGPGHPEHGREGLDRRRAPVLRGHRLRPGADLADHRLLRPAAGVRRGPLRRGRARGRRVRAHQRPPHGQGGGAPGRPPHLPSGCSSAGCASSSTSGPCSTPR